MLKLEVNGEESTVQIKDVTNYLIAMSELMSGCEAVMAQIAKVTGVGYDELMVMFLTVMADEIDSAPKQIE